MKFFGFLIVIFFAAIASAQSPNRDFDFRINGSVSIVNYYGKVFISVAEETEDTKVALNVESTQNLSEEELKISNEKGILKIAVAPQNSKARVDLTLKVPPRARLHVETKDGEVRIAGNVESADVLTETGTISTDVPADRLKFDFLWNSSRPRYLSDLALPNEVKERSGGRFTLSGKLGDEEKKKDKPEEEKKTDEQAETSDSSTGENEKTSDVEKAEARKKKREKELQSKLLDRSVKLNFTTERGIILLNVDPAQVPSNLQERPLTDAARAIVRSGDNILVEAIRRSSPKYFGDYLKTLPPRLREPSLAEKEKANNQAGSLVKQVTVRVADLNNRAVGGLQKSDFVVTEGNAEREILKVEATTAPFNLVLLLDVSGSVDNYVDFIRKAARNFVNTMSPKDKIAIIIFNEDVKQISTFTTDRQTLSESLDTFDAGGGTAFYDALGYTLVETLRPLRGERTAIIALSDGDDNRSFLPFEALVGSIQESGALIYPLYVPSALIAASKSVDPNATSDPLRARFMALSSKAEAEGERLAKVSGGVYYPIRQLGDLQKAYDDIVVQLRTAYTVTFRSDAAPVASDNRASPRLKVRVKRENVFVNTGSVIEVPKAQADKYTKETSEIFDEELKGNQRADFLNAVFIKSAFFISQSSNVQQPPEITGEVSGITYKPLLTNQLQIVSAENFDINKSPPAFVLDDGAKNNIAVSRWVSPKRTRSYPYERIYNTLLGPKKITIIPIIKDEGANGERDFLQFDTVSLLNLLNVYVVLGYYNDAQRDSSASLTDQQFDAEYVNRKIDELKNFKGTASEWNLLQLQNLSLLLEKAKAAYSQIAVKTGVALHDERGINNFAVRIGKSLEDFRLFSRGKSQKAQNREFQTVQPKEALSSDTKGRVTIRDTNGGTYFFTCDETKLENKTIYLIEDKHTVRAKMPSPSDIKDGLLKMMLYSNLKNVRVGNESVSSRAVLRLTSNKIEGAISSESSKQETENFFQTNSFNANQKGFVIKLFQEANENNFVIKIEQAETAK